MNEVFYVGSNATQDTKYRLDKKWWFHEATLKKMGERVEMTNIIAFKLKTRAATVSQLLQYVFDIFEVATPTEARAMLALKGGDRVAF